MGKAPVAHTTASPSPSVSAVPSATAAPPPSPTADVASDRWVTGQRFAGLQDSPENVARCRENLNNLGQRLKEHKDIRSMAELARLAPSESTCPTTGLQYVWLQEGEQVVLYCCGEAHSGLSLYWDGSGVSDTWPALDSADTACLNLQEAARRFDGNWVGALEVLQKLEENGTPADQLASRRTVAYEALNQTEEALAASRQTMDLYPNDETAFNLRCNALLLDGQVDEVLRLCDKWLTTHKDSELAHQNKVLAYLQDGDTAEADDAASQLHDAGFLCCSDLAFKRYSASWQHAERWLQEDGWSGGGATDEILTGLLACRLGSIDPELERARLLEALRRAPKVWPYPLLRYLNGDLTEDEILRPLENRPDRLVLAKYVLALDLMAHKREPEKVRTYLTDVAAAGAYNICTVAAAYLDELTTSSESAAP